MFNEEQLYDSNIFKFEERLSSSLNRYIDNGAILSTYYSIDTSASSIDIGSSDIDVVFGDSSPLKYNEIKNLPLYGINKIVPSNETYHEINNVSVDGECILLPSTIIPKPYDCFIINHVSMTNLFQVTDVQVDSMKINGYYKIKYRLYSTTNDVIDKLKSKVIENFNVELADIGTENNPIIQSDNFIKRNKIKRMISIMKSRYISMYYNDRHNCFIYDDGIDMYFDNSLNTFIMNNSIFNSDGFKSIVLSDKLHSNISKQTYIHSIYNWIEDGCNISRFELFHYTFDDSNKYQLSSFFRWNDDIKLMIAVNKSSMNGKFTNSYITSKQFDAVCDRNNIPLNEFDKLLWKYMHHLSTISINDVSLHISDAIASNIQDIDNYITTPIIIYILNKILYIN